MRPQQPKTISMPPFVHNANGTASLPEGVRAWGARGQTTLIIMHASWAVAPTQQRHSSEFSVETKDHILAKGTRAKQKSTCVLLTGVEGHLVAAKLAISTLALRSRLGAVTAVFCDEKEER